MWVVASKITQVILRLTIGRGKSHVHMFVVFKMCMCLIISSLEGKLGMSREVVWGVSLCVI